MPACFNRFRSRWDTIGAQRHGGKKKFAGQHSSSKPRVKKLRKNPANPSESCCCERRKNGTDGATSKQLRKNDDAMPSFGRCKKIFPDSDNGKKRNELTRRIPSRSLCRFRPCGSVRAKLSSRLDSQSHNSRVSTFLHWQREESPSPYSASPASSPGRLCERLSDDHRERGCGRCWRSARKTYLWTETSEKLGTSLAGLVTLTGSGVTRLSSSASGHESLYARWRGVVRLLAPSSALCRPDWQPIECSRQRNGIALFAFSKRASGLRWNYLSLPKYPSDKASVASLTLFW